MCFCVLMTLRRFFYFSLGTIVELTPTNKKDLIGT